MSLFVSALDVLVAAAHRVARDLGHDLEPWERAGCFEHLTFCRGCGLAAVVNSNASTQDGPYMGSVLFVPCQGRLTAPTWAPQIPWEVQSAA